MNNKKLLSCVEYSYDRVISTRTNVGFIIRSTEVTHCSSVVNKDCIICCESNYSFIAAKKGSSPHTSSNIRRNASTIWWTTYIAETFFHST